MRVLHLTNAQFAVLYDIVAETVDYLKGDLITYEDEHEHQSMVFKAGLGGKANVSP